MFKFYFETVVLPFFHRDGALIFALFQIQELIVVGGVLCYHFQVPHGVGEDGHGAGELHHTGGVGGRVSDSDGTGKCS